MPPRGVARGVRRVARVKASAPKGFGSLSELTKSLIPAGAGAGLAKFASNVGWGLVGLEALDTGSDLIGEWATGKTKRTLDLAEEQARAQQLASNRMLDFYQREENRSVRDMETQKLLGLLQAKEERGLASIEAQNQPYGDVLDEMLAGSTDDYSMQRGEAMDALMMQLSAAQAQDKGTHPLQLLGIAL